MDKSRPDRDSKALSHEVIAAAMVVHRRLGPGLLESAYEAALCHELALGDVSFRRQAELPIHYKGVHIGCGYRADIIVEGSLLLELKAVGRLEAIHEAQILTYLRLSGLWLGLLLNFNVRSLRHGIRRFVNGSPGGTPIRPPGNRQLSHKGPHS